MKTRILPTASLLVFLALISSGTGCATVLRGDHQVIRFEMDSPPVATVAYDGKTYETPVELSLERKKPHTIVISAPGYESIQFDLKAEWDGASLPGLVLPGGSLLFAADTATGADRSFSQLARIKLNKAGSAGTAAPKVMKERKGKILTDEEYDAAVAEERRTRRARFNNAP
jgi:hypothetical protein